jgi:hypothetical protein
MVPELSVLAMAIDYDIARVKVAFERSLVAQVGRITKMSVLGLRF